MTIEQIALAGLGIAVLLDIGVTVLLMRWYLAGVDMAEGIIDNYAPLEPTHDGVGRYYGAPVEVTMAYPRIHEPEGIIDRGEPE